MQAARFWGASEGTTITPDLAFYSWFANIVRTQLGYEQLLTRVRAQLGEEVFITAWNEGQTMTVEQLLGKQGSETEVQQHMSIASSSPNPTGLTAREVLRLLAQGLTSAQIAQKLVIGVVTVNFHVRSIYIKLGVSSRSAATRYALEHNLV
jgi:DNA-binding NarL/FixJ family response regulator